ncbi:MAG TPA: phytoene desaturase family protein [Candidatus Saccharimonadales bacterium]|nr:phytoene desaturase family protein [Candidatus Saccharimonadales bacterium]
MKIAVIGAGIGGLSAAARLSAAGHSVTVYEKEALPGGRAHVIKQDGYTFDTGPTLLMMTDVLEETFAACGRDLKDYLQLIQLEPNYRVVYPDHSSITMSSNMAALSTELAKIDPKAPEQFYRFFGRVAMIYRIAKSQFIDKNFDRLRDFIDPVSGAQLARYGGLKKLTDFVGSYFSDPRLVQLFSFQSMYLGVSPYHAPAVYSVISYMETGRGIWYPKGGMHQLPLALAKLTSDLGGRFEYNAPVKRILVDKGQAKGLELDDGRMIEADIVISNADLPYTYTKLLAARERAAFSDKRLAKLKHSSSAMLFYFGVNHELAQLLHHNVYFSEDFKHNLEEIFVAKVLPEDPAFYIYVPTKSDPDLAPQGRNVLYILVPVPNLDSKVDWATAQTKIRTRVLKVLKSHFGADIKDKIETEAVFTPQDFLTKYNLVHGAAFGLSHYFLQSGYFRPHNRVKGITGVYLTGASTYPGSGVPMVLLSGKLVSERITKDYAPVKAPSMKVPV